MNNAQTTRDAMFGDLPLFRGSLHRRIWEGLPQQAQEKVVQLLSDLLLDHAEPGGEGEESHE